MKLAPWVGGAAVMVLLGVAGWSRSEPCVCERGKATPLDFSGIDTLEVVGGNHPDIVLGGKPLEYSQPLDYAVTVERRGSALRVVAGDTDIHLTVTAPASLRRLVLSEGGDVNAEKGSVGDLTIEVHGSVSWKGDARSLRLLHRGAIKPCAQDEWRCNAEVTFWSGNIERFEARLPEGSMTLHDPDGVERLVVALGPDASWGMLNTHGRGPYVEVLAPGTPEDDDASAPGIDAATETSTATDVPAGAPPGRIEPPDSEPAAEPPRSR